MRTPNRRARTQVTIKDVARRAGVSVMTVSRVVNAKNNVRPTTRERVLSIVQELNYAPNLAARTLANADDRRIGLIYSNPSAAFLSQFLVGALDESTTRGVQLLLVKCQGFNVEATEQAVQQLIDAGVDGVVITPPVSELQVVLDRLREAGIVSVAVAAGRFQGDVSCVRVDDRRAAYDMTRLLLQMGHRRFGLIKGHPNHTATTERLAGFEAALAEKPGCEFATAQGFFTFESGLEAAEQLLDSPLAPTAIFASNDDMGAAAVSVAHRRGLDVPNDLSVVGFDDTAIATTLWPAMTTVRQPISEMSGRAIELLLQELQARREGATPGPIDCVIGHAIIERHSSAPPRAAMRRVT